MAKVTCKKCGKSWETEIEMKFCPFCGAKIEKEKPKHIDEMESLLITIRDDFGMEVFKNGKQTVALMRDLSPNLAQEIKLYQIVAKSNLFIKYEEAFQLTNEKRELKLTEIEQELESDYFLSKQHINTLKKWHMHLFNVKEDKKLTEKELKTIEKNLDELFDYFKPNIKFEETDHSQNKTNTLEKANIGDIVTFGTYAKEPITWRVLRKISNLVMVVSEKILDAQPFNEHSETNDWKKCSLRNWLNTKFYYHAFSDDERKRLETDVIIGDTIFLLSVDQAIIYFDVLNDKDRCAKGTNYALNQKLYVFDNGCSEWWLRTPGNAESCPCASSVRFNGTIDKFGKPTFYSIVGVRPAMWIRIK